MATRRFLRELGFPGTRGRAPPSLDLQGWQAPKPRPKAKLRGHSPKPSPQGLEIQLERSSSTQIFLDVFQQICRYFAIHAQHQRRGIGPIVRR